jgi:hypothetical protein
MSKTKAKPSPADAEIIPAIFARLMQERGSVGKALDCLHRNLDAKRSHYDSATGQWVQEDDAASQVSSAKALLSYAVGEPIKRQQILSGKMPTTPPTPAELRETINAKIAAQIERPDVSVAELVAARKALAEQEADAPKPRLSEEEKEAEVRRVLGIT